MLREELRLQPVEDRVCLFALSMLTGCVVYFALWHEPSWWSLLILGLGAGSVVMAGHRRGVQGKAQLVFVLIAGVLCGLYVAKAATARTKTITIEQTTAPTMLEGWLERVEPGKNGLRLRIRTHALATYGRLETPQIVRVTHRSALRVEPGRFVRCWVVLRPPPRPVIAGDYAFHRQAWYEGLGAVGYVQGRCRGGALGTPRQSGLRIQDQLHMWRRSVARHVEKRAGGFAAALASGDRSYMSMTEQEALRNAGLAHLMAISGLHMGIVGGLIYLIVWRGLALVEPIALRLSVRKPAAAAALISCFAYLLLSGASVSTQRAFIMALVVFGAVLMDRSALSLRSFAIAMIIVLTLAPWSALTPGFQMSFAATGALIVTYQIWRQRREAIGQSRLMGPVFWIQSLIVTSIVSSLATFPFALYHFDRFAELGLLANLLAMPIISLISAPLAILAIVSAPLGLSDWPLSAFGLSLDVVLRIAEQLSLAPEQRHTLSNKLPAVTLLFWLAALIIPCLMRPVKIGIGLGIALTLFGYVYWNQSQAIRLHWAPNGTVYTSLPGKTHAISLRDGPGLGPLRYAGLPIDSQCAASVECRGLQTEFEFLSVSDRAGAPTDCTDQIVGAIWLSPEAIIICAQSGRKILTWDVVKAQNGVTLKQRKDSFARVAKRPCGQRPWEPC